MTKQEKKLETQIQNLLTAMLYTSKSADGEVQDGFGLSKKTVLYNNAFALMKMIGEMKDSSN